MKPIVLTNQSEIARLHFNVPTLCFFRHEYDCNIGVGILLDNNIICTCCGGIIPLDEVDYLKYMPDDWIDLSSELYWILSDVMGEPILDDDKE